MNVGLRQEKIPLPELLGLWQGDLRTARGRRRQTPPASYLFSSFTGSTVRPKVEFVTAANDAYQAAIAVAMPK